MTEETVTQLTLAVHILSVVIVLTAVCLCVALAQISRALETWLPHLVSVLKRARVDGAEGH